MSKLNLEDRIKEIEAILQDIEKLSPDCKIMCEEIIDNLGNIESIHEDLETDLENMTEEKDILYDQLQSKSDPYDALKESVDRYNMGVKSEQETILKLLEDEFNLSLITL